MCGIAGKVWLNEVPDPTLLQTMKDSMHHRGPDDEGILFRTVGDRTFGLVSTRLSILDLTPAGHMPMQNKDGSIWIIYNGEIYNHIELRQTLASRPGVQFRSRSDTETLLLAYQEYGLACLPMLNGMFACAIFDLRQRKLVLARDRMGIKPLYYHWENTSFSFASELKTLLIDRNIARHLSTEALELYLALGFVPSPYSLFKDVRKLQPGHYLVLDDSGLRDAAYWSPGSLFEGNDLIARRDLIPETREIVTGAVRRQLMSDVPVGVLLSGGLDSTIVTAVTKAEHEAPLHTFSIGFRTRRSDLEEMYNWDREFARHVADNLGTVHHEVELDDEDNLIELIETRIAALDEPLWEASYLSISLLAQSAHENGVKVLLTGDGSDEFFGGYPWYLNAQRMELYEQIPLMAQIAGTLHSLVPDGEFKIKLGDLAKKSRQPSHIKYLLNQSHVPGDWRRVILGLSANGASDICTDFLADIFRPFTSQKLGDQYAFADQMLWVREHFNQRIDRMTMLSSVEARVPFQDNEVINFAAGIPIRMKAKGGVPKRLLREAFHDAIPEGVVRRSKRPFAAPSKSWLEGVLKDYAIHSLSEKNNYCFRMIDMMAVQKYTHPILQDSFSNGNNAGGIIPIWNLLALSIWLKQIPL